MTEEFLAEFRALKEKVAELEKKCESSDRMLAPYADYRDNLQLRNFNLEINFYKQCPILDYHQLGLDYDATRQLDKSATRGTGLPGLPDSFDQLWGLCSFSSSLRNEIIV